MSQNKGATDPLRIAEEIYVQRDFLEYTEKSGPRCTLSCESKPIEYFELFFDLSLWSLIVEETNKYAEYSRCSSGAEQSSKTKDWKPVTVLEMKAFTAVLLEMGITKRPSIRSYWTVDSRNIPWFRKMFPRNRFQQILKYFHLIDNSLCFPPGHKRYDPCAKFGPLVRHANTVFKLHYTPHKELTIDESFVGTLCHSNITQYLPDKKPHQWGLKFWTLFDASSKYCLTFYYYEDAKAKTNSDAKIFGRGYDVVINLLKESNCLNKGHHIFVDKFLSSVDLAKYLYSTATYLTGTIRSNRKEIPDHLKIADVNKVKYFRNEDVLFCAYREKKSVKNPVLLISTQAVDQDVIIIKRLHSREIHSTKPSIIHSYKTYMGGVDESDKMLYTYLYERRTVTYWKKVAFNIMNNMVLNAYIIYKETAGEKAMSRLDFISKIIDEIECEWMAEKKPQYFQTVDTIPSNFVRLPGHNLRQCSVCCKKDNIKRSRIICVQCNKGVHRTCFDKHNCPKREIPSQSVKMEKTFGLVKLPGRNLRQCAVCCKKDNIKRSRIICVQCKKGVHRSCFDKHNCPQSF